MNESLQPFEIQRESLAERLKLKDQWESQIRVLNEAGILEILPESQELGVIGVDGQQYPIPEYSDVLNQLTPENLELLEAKQEEDYNKLIITPFAMPLKQLIDRYSSLLKRKDKTGELKDSQGNSINISDGDEPIKLPVKLIEDGYDDTLLYFGKLGEEQETGKTKKKSIEQGKIWHFCLVQDTNSLENKRIETKIDSYLQEGGLSGYTLEDWLMHAITNLQESGKQIDCTDSKEIIPNWLMGSYLPKDDCYFRAAYDIHDPSSTGAVIGGAKGEILKSRKNFINFRNLIELGSNL